jgi:WD40 repeat protein
VRLWNTATRQPIGAPIQTGAHNGVTALAFSPDGKLLATAGINGTVRLWNTATRQPIGAPIQTGAHNGVTALAFSPDGKLLASTGANGTVRLWQVSLFANPYAALCADVGPPTRQEWNHYAFGERQPKVCS